MPYMPKGQWLKILVILPSKPKLRQPRSRLPEIMSSEYPAGRNAVFPPLHFSRKIMKRRNV